MAWKKIGKLSKLLIYPVKSSPESVRYTSCQFYDYGMCKQDRGIHFYDGMFIVYNETRDKFEDARKYPLLQRIKAEVTDNAKVTLSDKTLVTNKVEITICKRINLRICTIKETWSENDVALFYALNQQINTWVKNMIEADEDIFLMHTIPFDWPSSHKIKNNWNDFVQGYKTMEEDKTGRLITLPRFVLMTSQTYQELITKIDANVAPNIIVDTDKLINPFEEKNWDWIKIGNEIILKRVKPVPRGYLNENFEHCGIYYGLYRGGTATEDDDVFFFSFN